MSGQSIQLLTNASATSSTYTWAGGRGTITVVGSWAGTVKLQYLASDGTTWLDVGADVTFTANGMANFELAAGQIRVNVATATAVYARVAQI